MMQMNLKQMTRKQWTIAGGAMAAVVIIAAVLVTLSLTVWAQPSKQDFEVAKKDGEKVVSDYQGSAKLNAFSKAVVTEGRAGKSQGELVKAVADEKKAVVDTINSRRALADKTAESRVLKDEALKKSFDAYYANEKTYDAYYIGYVDAFPRYYSSLTTCAKIFKIAQQATDDKDFAGLHKTAAKGCLEDLNALSKTSITPYANYAKEFKRIVDERQRMFDGVADGSIQTVVANAKISQLRDDQIKNDPTDAVSKYAKDASFNGELIAFIEALDKKIKAVQ